MDKFVVNNREDGMGSRIYAMMNAFYMAKRLESVEHMRFTWNREYFLQDSSKMTDYKGDEKKQIIGMSVEEKEEVFSQNFIDKYYLSTSTLYDSPNLICWDMENQFSSVADIQKVWDSDRYKYYTMLLPGLQWAFSDVEENEYRRTCSRLFKKIEFSNKCQSMIDKAHEVANSLGAFSCVHVRSGDAIYDYAPYRLEPKTAFTHATNAALAFELIQKEASSGAKVIVIGDDVSTNDELVRLCANENVISINTLRDALKLSNLECFMFDIIFMSRARRLYGTFSALVRNAWLINADLELVFNYHVFEPLAYYEVLKKNYERLKHLHPSQVAFILFHLFWAGLAVNEECEVLCGYLDEALKCDAVNEKYRIYKIYCLLKYKRLDEAESEIKQILASKHDEFIKLLFFKNWAGSFEEVFEEYFKNASAKYAHISYVAFQIALYQQDYRAFEFAKSCEVDLKSKLDINLSLKLGEKAVQEINELNQSLNHLREKNAILQNELDSFDVNIKKQKLANLKLEEGIKKLEMKEREKRLGLRLSKLEPRVNLILNEDLRHSALARVRNHLAFKLGAAVVACSKSLWGMMSLPFVASFITKEHERERKAYKALVRQNPSLKLPELESYADYKEALNMQENKTYQFGLAFMKACKTWYKGGFVRFYFEIKRLNHKFKGV